MLMYLTLLWLEVLASTSEARHPFRHGPGVLYPDSGLGGPSLQVLESLPDVQKRQVSSDPCATLASTNNTLFTVAQARACLKSVPFDDVVRQNVLDVVQKIYNLDIFEYEQLNQSLPLNQSTNIRAELSRIGNATYSCDYDFNRDLYSVFNSLNDGHHYYSSCYSNAFISFTPFPLVALASSLGANDTKIYIAPGSNNIAAQYNIYFENILDLYETQGINITELSGAEVQMIDGMEPMAFIDYIANNETGTYPDIQVRRNAAMASYTLVGSTITRTLGSVAQQTFPERDNITFQISTESGSKQVVVPYFARAISDKSYASTSTFFQENCLSTGSTASDSKEDVAHARNPTSIFPHSINGPIKRQTSSACEAPSSPYLPLLIDSSDSAQYLGGRNVQFFVLSKSSVENEIVGVIFLATFEPDEGCTSQFLEDTSLGFQNFTEAGVTKVIIDTTQNGGGSVTLNIVWQSIFSGTPYQEYLNFEGVLRAAPLAEKFLNYHIQNPQADAGLYGPLNFRAANGNDLLSNFNYFSVQGNIVENGQTLKTSQPLRDVLYQNYLSRSSSPVYSPADVAIYGDGTCGSACASFTSFITQYLNYTTVVQTGTPNSSIEFQSFEAGQATTSSAIYLELNNTLLTNDTDSPPPLLVQSTVGIALRGHLSPFVPEQFLQYISRPANYTFAHTVETYNNPFKAHAYIATQIWASSNSSSLTPSVGTVSGSSGGNSSTTSSSGNNSNQSGADKKALGLLWVVGSGAFALGMTFLVF
ncbi:hypothetical protein [Phaffia rhodozyma]|uniref:Tail specific protease domain-containing protein n=1 Tax=Phaffia rhodozyma TaxID=264483 RepID=A0A0F7SPF8_PHARH|nr:hypothetical protein [Phaffia rhodozyma]